MVSCLAEEKPARAEDIRAAGHAMAGFSAPVALRSEALKKFLFYRMYRHPHVIRSRERQRGIIRDLFTYFCHDPRRMPQDWAGRCGAPDDIITQGVVRDYIAGMTDSYAWRVHKKLCTPKRLQH